MKNESLVKMEMNAEVVVDVRKLNYKSGNRYLLKNVNWQVNRGENWILFGLNGCGKTTLLSIIAGYKGFLDGSVQVFGEPYTDCNVLQHRNRIAWISSSFFDRYYTSESVLNIVLSGLSGTFGLPYQVTTNDVQKAKKLLKSLRIEQYCNYPYNRLSKGERQNVLIARALMHDAELFILDEPCSGLDVNARDNMLQYIRSLAKNPEITVIYVTHYAEEISEEFEHAILMRNGRIVQQGNTAELFSSESMRAFLECDVQCSWQNGRLHMQFAPDEEGRWMYE
ncbi:MAG: ATP-binding cassette domain-containing protein [Peptococcaceae bacterium]|nr:ATP-binding cassette domain-containing protein [Peptococcaceae bacterium]